MKNPFKSYPLDHKRLNTINEQGDVHYRVLISWDSRAIIYMVMRSK